MINRPGLWLLEFFEKYKVDPFCSLQIEVIWCADCGCLHPADGQGIVVPGQPEDEFVMVATRLDSSAQLN